MIVAAETRKNTPGFTQWASACSGRNATCVPYVNIRHSVTSDGKSAAALSALPAVNGTARGWTSVSSTAVSVIRSATAATALAIQNRPVKSKRPTSAMPVIGPTAIAMLPAAP